MGTTRKLGLEFQSWSDGSWQRIKWQRISGTANFRFVNPAQ